MLTSITPLGERARNNRWWLTVGAHILGALVGGAMVGALLGLAGSPLASAIGRVGVLGTALAATILAAGMDLGLVPIPGLERQVNEDWMVTYRGWIYGAGFGFQLGTGFATIITSGATWLTLVLAFLSGSWGWGGVVLGVFGLVRGLVVLSTRHVRDRGSLMRFSARMIALGSAFRRVVLGAYPMIALFLLGRVLVWN